MTFRSSIASRKKLDGKLLLDTRLAPKLKPGYFAFKFKSEPHLCTGFKIVVFLFYPVHFNVRV